MCAHELSLLMPNAYLSAHFLNTIVEANFTCKSIEWKYTSSNTGVRRAINEIEYDQVEPVWMEVQFSLYWNAKRFHKLLLSNWIGSTYTFIDTNLNFFSFVARWKHDNSCSKKIYAGHATWLTTTLWWHGRHT